MTSILRLIAATPDTHDLLVGALGLHGIACRDEGEIVVVESNVSACEERQASARVVALLRDALPAPEREEISVMEDLAFPREFPVTTRLEAWWTVSESSRFDNACFDKALATDAFSIWFQPMVNTVGRMEITRVARSIPPSAHPEWRESLVSVGFC